MATLAALGLMILAALGIGACRRSRLLTGLGYLVLLFIAYHWAKIH
jgi:hypothetical protein